MRVSKREPSDNRWKGVRLYQICQVVKLSQALISAFTYREIILHSGYIWNVNNTDTKADHFNVKCYEIATFIKKNIYIWKFFISIHLVNFVKKCG